jgi:hypothetical protein
MTQSGHEAGQLLAVGQSLVCGVDFLRVDPCERHPRARKSPIAVTVAGASCMLRFDGRESFFAGFGFDQLIPGVAQQIAQDLPVILLVFDDKDAFAHGSLT